jgi:hypothetical protein
MALAWSWVVLALGLFTLVVMPPLILATEDGYCENIDHPGPCASAVDLFAPGLVVTAAGVVHVASVRALRRGRRWGRPAVLAIFGLWSAGLLVGLGVAVTGHGADEAEPSQLLGLLAWLAYPVAVVVLVGRPGASSPPGGELAMGPDQGRS